MHRITEPGERASVRDCRDVRCTEMAGWQIARGPGRLIERVLALLEPVGDGFTELVRLRERRFRGLLPWSRLPRDVVTIDLMVNGPIVIAGLIDPHGLDLASSVRIRCDACGRTFEQAWVFERGSERWTVTEPPRRQPDVI